MKSLKRKTPIQKGSSVPAIKVSSILLLLISVFLYFYMTYFAGQTSCKNLTKKDAIEIVMEKGEAKKLFKEPKIIRDDMTSTASISAETEEGGIIWVHLYRIVEYPNYSDDPELAGHTDTVNGYILDACTGEVLSSFAEYDEAGNLLEVNPESVYP